MIKITLLGLLRAKKIKAVELHRETGLTEAAICLLLNNKTESIKFETLDKICKALDCKVSDIIKYYPENF